MAQVQIDEAALRQLQMLAGTVQAISANPEARLMLQKAQKTAIPNSHIPDLDRVAAQDEWKKDISGKIDQFLTQQQKRDAEAEVRQQQQEFQSGWERQKNLLRDQGYMDDTIEKIEKHAQDNGIANLRAAAHDFLALNPAPPPADSRTFGGWTSLSSAAATDGSDPFMKAMVDSQGGNESAVDAEAWAAIREFREASQPMRRGR